MSAPRSQARQWSRTACAVGLLFGSLPLAGRFILGTWEFAGAAEISFVLLMLGAYFHIRSRRYATKPDPATLLDQASQFASNGRIDRAIVSLTRTIRQSPKLWQAYQYRGELRLRLGDVALAAQDFSEAIRLAPNEPHLYVLRDRATNVQASAISGQPAEE